MSDKADLPMQDLKPTVWIGKQGCTATMIEEIVAQLKKRTVIKVKWLQNTGVDPAWVATQAKATLVEVRGRTMVLARKGKAAPEVPRPPVKAPRNVTAKALAKEMAMSRERPAPGAAGDASGAKKPRITGTMRRAKK
jgi:RNA-binding protein